MVSILSTFALRRAFSLLDGILRVGLNTVSAVVVGAMKEMMMTRMAVLRARGDRRASGECRMSLEAELLIKKGWVERTESQRRPRAQLI